MRSRKTTPTMLTAVVAGLTSLAPGACDSRPPPLAPLSSSAVVARVDGRPIHADEVRATMRRRQLDARQALDELLAFESLAGAALASGAVPATTQQADPGDRAATRAVMVQRLIERELEPQLTEAAITDAEVRALYQRGKQRFVHGRLVQIVVLCVFTGARMKAERRAQGEQTARALAAFVAQRPDRTAADFERIAADKAWTDRKVNVTTVWQGLDEPFPQVVGAAAQALRRLGDTTPLVGDETGYYIARYLDEQPARNVPFEQAAAQLRRDMYEPWRKQKFLRLTLELAGPHQVEAFPHHLR